MSSLERTDRPERVTDEDVVDQLIDDVLAGRSRADSREDLAALYALASSLHTLSGEPIPSDTQTLQLAAIRAHVTSRSQATPAPSWRRRLRSRVAAVAAGATALATLTGGGAVAAASEAVPGDPLYGLKRATEQVRLALADDPEAQAHLRLAFAERRLEEAGAVPSQAEELTAEAIQETQEAAEDAGAEALTRLSALVDEKIATENLGNARFAIARACVRIAERHGHAVPGSCQATADAAPTTRGKVPGTAPGRSGEAPGRSGQSRSGTDASTDDATDDAGQTGTTDENAGEDGDPGPPDEVPPSGRGNG